MKCPNCSEPGSLVRDSRPRAEDLAIRRRRHCTSCGHRFTTIESEIAMHDQLAAASREAATMLDLLPRLAPGDAQMLVAMAARLARRSDPLVHGETRSMIEAHA